MPPIGLEDASSVPRLLEEGVSRPIPEEGSARVRVAPAFPGQKVLQYPPKWHVGKTKQGNRSHAGQSRSIAARERDPSVVLVTSLSGEATVTDQVTKSSARRIQIEEPFRDAKDEYHGLGLNRARSRFADRTYVLLLLNAIVLVVAWLFGKVVELREIYRHYQANNTKPIPFVRAKSFFSSISALRVVSRAPLDLAMGDLHRRRLNLVTH